MKSHYHCVYDLNYHLVLVTKYRKKCLSSDIRTELKDIIERLLQDVQCELIEFNGEEDHIHVLFAAHPVVQLSKLVCSVKTVTSRLVRKNHVAHFSKYYFKPVLWERAYCLLSTGGANIETIRKYIGNQGKTDK